MPLVTLRLSLSRRSALLTRSMRESSSDLGMSADDDIVTDTGDAFVNKQSLHRISEQTWRMASQDHSRRIREIISPGLTAPEHHLNTGLQRQWRQRERRENRGERQTPAQDGDNAANASIYDSITALDPKHPVYNFLIEYYGLKGTKGVRRLLKWPPGMQETAIGGTQQETLMSEILLVAASEQDFFKILLAKGAGIFDETEQQQGVVYSPLKFVYGNQPNLRFHQHNNFLKRRHDSKHDLGGSGTTRVTSFALPPSNGGPLAPFVWYRSLLQRTLEATPVLHCYGLHEWAMQYQPTIIAKDDETFKTQTPSPPSSKYQSHMKLRIDQETLNETVEANTLFCTHVDAWKFFAKEALPRNQFVQRKSNNNRQNADAGGLPAADERSGWLLRSEQPACIHTTMDLLKIALKLGPFCDPDLFCRVLALTVEARLIDVAASPYDAKTGYGVEPIRIETSSGRYQYKQRQIELMKRAAPIRKDLLENYEHFLSALC